MTPKVTRRWLLNAAFAAGIAGASTSTSTAETGGGTTERTEPTGWPMFNHGPSNNAYVTTETGPSAPVSDSWLFTVDDTFGGQPAVVDGTVYAGTTDGHLYALDASDGSTTWEFDAGARVYTPAVVDGTVYVGVDDGVVYALDAATGTEQWHHDPGESIFGFTSPTVVEGTCYVVGAGALHAIDAAAGSVRWRVDDVFGPTPAVAEGVVYAVGGGGVRAVDAADGSRQWFAETEGDTGALSVAGETVYTTESSGAVVALDVTDGTERWRFETRDRVWTPPTVTGGTLYVGDQGYHLYALDADTGSKEWEVTAYGLPSSPLVVDGVIYLGVSRYVEARDPADGTQLWNVEVAAGSGTQCAVVDGRVYATTTAGTVSELREQTSTETETSTRVTDEATTTEEATATVATSRQGTAAETTTDEGAVGGDPLSLTDWLAGWGGLLAWLGGVTVLAPLVLGTLVAAYERLRPGDDGDDGSGAE